MVLDGASSLFPKRNFSSMRRQLIDYYGTRWGKLPISQEDFLVHEATNHRLHRYSTFGGTCSPHPKRIISSMRRQIIDYYSTRSSDGTSSLFPKRNFFIYETTNYSTTSVLNLRLGQIVDYYGTRSSEGYVPHIPRRFSRP